MPVDLRANPLRQLTAKSRPQRLPDRTSFTKGDGLDRQHAARDFAFSYLDLWSAQNPVALSSAAKFYGSSVVFHGQRRSFASVLAEKRRFAERWPERNYRYRPETTQVACETAGDVCTVWSIFDYSATDPRRRRRPSGSESTNSW